MTGDELERAIKFLLQSQANFEVRLEETDKQLKKTDQQIEQTNQQLAKTDQQVEQTNLLVSSLAETQAGLMRTMLQHVEAQGEINTGLRRKTSKLERLQQVTEQRMSELAQAQQQAHRDVSDLTKTVGDLVKAVYRNGNPPQG